MNIDSEIAELLVRRFLSSSSAILMGRHGYLCWSSTTNEANLEGPGSAWTDGSVSKEHGTDRRAQR